MRERRTAWIAGCVAAILLTTGCAKRAVIGFYNVAHREQYAISDADLERLQFYISRDVIVHSQPAPGLPTESVIILRKGTPGVVIDAGPDWVTVRFGKGGTGVQFLADANKAEDLYWFATEVEGKSGLYKLSAMPRKVLLHQGQRYLVVEGSDAFLLVDRKDLEKFIASRTHVEGQTLQ
jgi:hypothetical protein